MVLSGEVADGVRCPARVVDEFSADYIFDACGKVVERVKAFEQLAAGNRASRKHRVRGVSRFREEDPVYPEASEVGGGGGVLACEEV
jgi:hypothetical protein